MDNPVVYFHPAEFACRCGCGFNSPDPRLIAALEQLRADIKTPIVLNCACRCPSHNAAVGGEANSQHMLGKAADIRCPEMSTSQLMSAAELIPDFHAGGIGYYPGKGFVHVDVRQHGQARWRG